jgi:hypothetical protein
MVAILRSTAVIDIPELPERWGAPDSSNRSLYRRSTMKGSGRFTLILGVVLLSFAFVSILMGGAHLGGVQAKRPDQAQSDRAQDPVDPVVGRVDYCQSFKENDLVFVGNSQVDLKWVFETGDTEYQVKRDGGELVRLANTETFYRDPAAPSGTHNYQLVRIKDTGDIIAIDETVTLGEVHGCLYRDIVWSTGTYTLHNNVEVMQGKLTIRPKVRVTVDRTVCNPFFCGLTGPGTIQIDGAALKLDYLDLETDASYLKTSNAYLSSLDITADSLVDGNTFRWVNIYVKDDADAIITNNTFNVHHNIEVTGQSYATIHKNVINNPSWSRNDIRVESPKGSKITDNTFLGCASKSSYEGSVIVDSDGPVEIRGNRFRCIFVSGTGGIGVWSNSTGVIEENVFEGPGQDSGMGFGSFVGVTVAPFASMAIRQNSFSNLSYGVLIEEAGASVSDNRFMGNHFGIYADGDGDSQAAGNCFEEGGGGAYVENRTAALDLKGNWWGDPSGPSHLSHPDGKGVFISGGPVDFSGWITDPENAGCGVTDLSIIGMEVVQSVQTISNTVPLVANKDTVVRVYPDIGFGEEHNVDLELTFYQGGAKIGTIKPWLGIPTVKPVHNLDLVRADENKGATVQLTTHWLTSTITIVAEVNPEREIEEVAYHNNTFTRTVTFQPRDWVNLAILRIDHQPPGGGGGLPAGMDEFLVNLGELLVRMYPYGFYDGDILVDTYKWYLPMDDEATAVSNATQLTAALRSWFNSANRKASTEYTQLVGIFPSNVLNFCSSDPPWFGGTGRVSFCDHQVDAVVHEIGHNLGLRHVNTIDSCGAKDPYTEWPHTDASIQDYGWDSQTRKVIDKTYYDVMAYCEPRWISAYHYRQTFDAIGAPSFRASINPLTQDYLVISGLVSKAGNADFLPIWQMDADREPENPPLGDDYCLEIRDAGEAVLASHCFDLAFYHYEAAAEMDWDSFSVILPFDENIASVVMRKNATEVGRVTASTNPPRVDLLSPDGGEVLNGSIEVSWAASDLDGDDLAYSLFYSVDDGSTWKPVAVNITGTTTHRLDLAWAPGSTTARMRIEASDGFHTARDDSDGAFTVDEKAPSAIILYPDDGEVLTATLTNLTGYGYDLEDGVLKGASVAWTSDLDGDLGTGERLWDVHFTEGDHTLTLTVTDSTGKQDTASVTITVGDTPPGPSRDIFLPLAIRAQ